MSEDQKNKKTHHQHMSRILMYALILVLIAMILFFPKIFVKEKTTYCHFETSFGKDNGLPRDECINMKIVSTQKINLSQFQNLNNTDYECFDSYSKLPKCDNNNWYGSAYQLKLFCQGCNIDGYICMQYSIYYHEQNEYIKMYEDALMQKRYNSSEEAEKDFLDCKGRY